LYEMSPPPKHLATPVVSRIKVMASLNISERRLPQDGRIKFAVGNRQIDLRVSTLPTQFGESVVLRVLDRSAVNLDPQHRLLLEVAWEALENAGIAPKSLAGTKTGVFVGGSTGEYTQLVREKGADNIDASHLTGSLLTFATGRLSHFLDLQGPSLTVDTACSSSLVAVHLACQSLRSGESRLALVGGVNLMFSPEANVLLSKFGGLSPDSVLVSRDGRTRLCDPLIASCATLLEGVGLSAAKLAYSAPEQIHATAPLAPPLDVFACAVMLWELLSGRRLLSGSRDTVERKLLEHDLPDLRTQLPDDHTVSRELIALVGRGLSADPGRRPQTPAAFVAELEQCGHELATLVQVSDFVADLSGKHFERRSASLSSLSLAALQAAERTRVSSSPARGAAPPSAAPPSAAPPSPAPPSPAPSGTKAAPSAPGGASR